MADYKDYGYNDVSADHVSEYILNPVLNNLKGEKDKLILDVGCGNGWLVNELIDKGYDAYGIDASETGVNLAKKINANRFWVQDINSEQLPAGLNSKKFQIIISTEVIEHLYNPVKYIKFCKSILLKSGGGKLILTTPYHGYLKNVVLALSDKMDHHYSPIWEGGHIKFWSKETLNKFLTDQGFIIEAFEGCGRLPYLWKSMLVTASVLNQ
ncbi:MAG: class I SAM-dependent methyltransferase [Bacteroidia bacterium]